MHFLFSVFGYVALENTNSITLDLNGKVLSGNNSTLPIIHVPGDTTFIIASTKGGRIEADQRTVVNSSGLLTVTGNVKLSSNNQVIFITDIGRLAVTGGTISTSSGTAMQQTNRFP